MVGPADTAAVGSASVNTQGHGRARWRLGDGDPRRKAALFRPYWRADIDNAQRNDRPESKPEKSSIGNETVTGRAILSSVGLLLFAGGSGGLVIFFSGRIALSERNGTLVLLAGIAAIAVGMAILDSLGIGVDL